MDSPTEGSGIGALVPTDDAERRSRTVLCDERLVVGPVGGLPERATDVDRYRLREPDRVQGEHWASAELALPAKPADVTQRNRGLVDVSS
jgi:hypothetical protein